jgi:hypothetical protein
MILFVGKGARIACSANTHEAQFFVLLLCGGFTFCSVSNAPSTGALYSWQAGRRVSCGGGACAVALAWRQQHLRISNLCAHATDVQCLFRQTVPSCACMLVVNTCVAGARGQLAVHGRLVGGKCFWNNAIA